MILASGLINVETSARVSGFPVEYTPIEYPFFGVETFVSGVGFNVAKALKTLGDDVELLTRIGDDVNGMMALETLRREGLSLRLCKTMVHGSTATSAILVDSEGRRKIYCDLKDLQDRPPFDPSILDGANYDFAVLTNINFNRDLLGFIRKKGIKIATDVHVLGDIWDSYNREFMENADVLFLSNEAIKGHEGDFLRDIYNVYHNEVIVVGCGEEGALMYLGKENRYVYEPAVAPRGIVSTIGAGDALFSAFVHYYHKGEAADSCLKKAVHFAGIKIATSGGSNGFVTEAELNSSMGEA